MQLPATPSHLQGLASWLQQVPNHLVVDLEVADGDLDGLSGVRLEQRDAVVEFHECKQGYAGTSWAAYHGVGLTGPCGAVRKHCCGGRGC